MRRQVREAATGMFGGRVFQAEQRHVQMLRGKKLRRSGNRRPGLESAERGDEAWRTERTRHAESVAIVRSASRHPGGAMHSGGGGGRDVIYTRSRIA